MNLKTIDAEILYDPTNIKNELIRKAGLALRGEVASELERDEILALICKLEGDVSTNADDVPQKCRGDWECIYCSTYLFRSSPFFMAARAVCKEGEEAERFNMFCRLHREALAFTSIGHVRQTLTESQLISSFETNAAVIPGLPIVMKGTIVSSADIELAEGNSLKLSMDTVKISDSNVPLLKDFLRDFNGLESKKLGDFLQSNIPSYKNPVPEFRCYFVDQDVRICRDQDDNVFVYTRL